MTDIEMAQITERVGSHLEHWPTLSEAFGCVDCGYLFRRATDHVCPLCGSGSIFEVAHFFNLTRNQEQQLPEVVGSNPTPVAEAAVTADEATAVAQQGSAPGSSKSGRGARGVTVPRVISDHEGE